MGQNLIHAFYISDIQANSKFESFKKCPLVGRVCGSTLSGNNELNDVFTLPRLHKHRRPTGKRFPGIFHQKKNGQPARWWTGFLIATIHNVHVFNEIILLVNLLIIYNEYLR